ncbi:MAG: rhodanese-like domain-containing protein [Dysgonomonas sp.]|nr:rhodanese-like domain-containing protein [Dysgonomonas sp.]
MNLKTICVIALIATCCIIAVSCKGQTIDNKQLKEIYQKENTIVVDVRTEKEFGEGHFENSINIPLSEISKQENQERLKPYENIITICRSGRRSGKAMQILKEKGFENVYNGGGWKSFETIIIQEE